MNKNNNLSNLNMHKKIMSYKYSPIYKYSILLLVIFLYFKHQKSLPQEKILINSVIIILIFILFDYVLINNHPNLFNNEKQKKPIKYDLDDLL
jgi:hypothetical protein